MGYGHEPPVLNWKPCTRVATTSQVLLDDHCLLGNSIVISLVLNIGAKAAMFADTSNLLSPLLIWMS